MATLEQLIVRLLREQHLRVTDQTASGHLVASGVVNVTVLCRELERYVIVAGKSKEQRESHGQDCNNTEPYSSITSEPM